jgi:2-dehydropantoate 2-reductase
MALAAEPAAAVKIAMMGSGGVGGFFGGRLAKAGHDVTFIARGKHLAALRADGLTIESEPQGDIHLPRVKATDDPASVGPVDVVILSVKLWDTEAALEAIRPMLRPDTAVISLQNGVAKEEILPRVLARENIMGGVCYVATTIDRPGVIRQTGTMQRIVVGEYGGERSARAVALHEALAASGVKAELTDDVRRAIWEKFVFLVGLSGATATMRLSIGPIRANPQTRAFFADLMRETVAVGRALGVALPADYAEQRLEFADGLPADMTASLHHDLERGNPLEVRWLAGGVVELGHKAGVPTPCNRAVHDILVLHAEGRKA